MIELEIASSRRIEARDITEAVSSGEYPDGLLWVTSPHTTSALLIGEADAALLQDLERMAAEFLAPLEPFSHARAGNPNASAHLFSSLLGTQLWLRVRDGVPDLGTYQRVLFLELDGPRHRRVRLEHVKADFSQLQQGGRDRW